MLIVTAANITPILQYLFVSPLTTNKIHTNVRIHKLHSVDLPITTWLNARVSHAWRAHLGLVYNLGAEQPSNWRECSRGSLGRLREE